MRRNGSVRTYIFVVKLLHMCWREGVIDEVRMMKSSERLRVWPLSFQKWSTIKRFLNERKLTIFPF